MSNPNFITHSHEINYKLRQGIAVAALALTTVIGLEGTTHAFSNAADELANTTSHSTGFSESTHPYPVGNGDGLYDAASTVKGIDTVDVREVTSHIENMSENKTVLKDGLQPGEVLTVPDSVK
jgi:hypothetical protein